MYTIGLMEMVPVQGGAFQFGDKIKVTVSDFMIGKYPVTQKQWQEIMGNNPSYFKGDDLPVESVSWEDAQAFIKKLNERFPGNHFRLPSEAEWEYAARGGRLSKGYEYAGSNDLNDVGWYWENSGDKPLSGEWNWDKIEKNNGCTHPVGQKKANELGLYDMCGNVWEWCADWYGDYPTSQQNNPKGPEKGVFRVLRGGSCYSLDYLGRLSNRSRLYPYLRLGDIGFRLARHL